MIFHQFVTCYGHTQNELGATYKLDVVVPGSILQCENCGKEKSWQCCRCLVIELIELMLSTGWSLDGI